MKKVLDRVRTGIFLIMCILFTVLCYIYLDGIFLRTTKTWPIGITVIIAIVILDYVSRKYIKNLIAFFLIHIGFIGAAVLFGQCVIDQILLGGIAVVFLLMAINFWKTEVNERSRIVIDIPFAGIIMFIFIYFHTAYTSLPNAIANYAYVAGIAFFLLFFIREYLDKFTSYTLSSENFTKELKGTFATNFSLIAFFNIVIILIIMTANMFFSNSSFNIVGRFFKFIFSKLFGLLERFDNTGSTSEEIATEIPVQNNSAGETLIAHKSTHDGNNIGTLLFNVFQIVIFVALICGVIFIIYSFIKQYLHRKNISDDDIKSTDGDVVKKVKAVHTDNEGDRKTLFMSNKDKIRKAFTNKVNSSTKKNNRIVIRKSYTPDQIGDSLTKEDAISKENMEELTRLYEKARYSDKEITKEDVDTVKKL